MKKRFQRNTKQRQVILDCLRGVETHPTAHDLYEMVRADLPRVSLGTIYRNLELLCEMGVVQKLQFSGQAHYDATAGPHIHFRCEGCGCVRDLDIPKLDLDSIKEYAGCRISRYCLHLFGYCEKCQEELDAETAAEPENGTESSDELENEKNGEPKSPEGGG